MANRLATEKSPYLLQHARNPVNWYPWGDEAFAQARRENKPIFLSVGYSTCHWCHVMEHESFENDAVAAIMNREFIAIKVDREERPDVDRVYMTFVQATTGSGGWPMSVWLTPDLKPFYGGTYFPPESRWNRPGFSEILTEIAKVWRENNDGVRQSAESLTARLRDIDAGGSGGSVPGAEVLARGVSDYAAAFDARRGGFGQAPKFPRPSELLFLLRESERTGEPHPREMAARTLQAMAVGGMRDHIGGGFHRYSVDADWRVPHFEKMLYDQAQLTLAYLDAFQATGEGAYADVAVDTLAYVSRDLADAEGGFFSAEAADSVPPEGGRAGGVRLQPDVTADARGVRLEPDAAPDAAPARKLEGAFYLWTDDELDTLLGSNADIVRARFGVEPDGNVPSDPHNEFGRGNQLYAAKDLDDLSRQFGAGHADLAHRLAAARERMFVARGARPRPHLDDKIITAWNGLMIAAYARSARVLGHEAHLVAARRAATFVREHLWDSAGEVLLRRYRDGDAAIAAYADDYANLVWGLLELFQADGDPDWLAWAIILQRRQDALFWDAGRGAWFSTTGADTSVLLRLKEDYDGAEPAASSVGALNLLTLAHLTGDATWRARLDSVFGAFAGRLSSSGRAMPLMLAALSAHHAGVQQVVIVGPRHEAATAALARAVSERYRPFAVIVTVEPGEAQERLRALAPAIGAMTMIDGKPTAYECRDFVCLAPVTDPAHLSVAGGR